MQDLGALNPNAPEVQALGVSDDGSKVVGWSRGVSGFQRPFIWTSAAGMQELANVPGTDAVASDISPDGSIIAAQSGVAKSLPGGVWFGYPAVPLAEAKEQIARIHRLGKLFARVREIEKKLGL